LIAAIHTSSVSFLLLHSAEVLAGNSANWRAEYLVIDEAPGEHHKMNVTAAKPS
jgi:hypothetical protein